MWLIGKINGFPRHLSQHVDGFVIIQGRLDTLCSIENAAMADRTVIDWDEDDIETPGAAPATTSSIISSPAAFGTPCRLRRPCAPRPTGGSAEKTPG